MHDSRKRQILVAVAVAAIAYLLYVARDALFPFILSVVLAFILTPIVTRLEGIMPWRRRRPALSRILAIAVIYLAALCVVALAVLLIVPPAVSQASQLIDLVPELFTRARIAIESWNQEYVNRIPEEIRVQIQNGLNEVGEVTISAARSVVMRTVEAVSSVFTIVFGLLIVPFFLFYILKDQEKAAASFYDLFPARIQPHARNILAIVNTVFGRYVRTQFVLVIVVGGMVFIGLSAIGVPYAVLLGIIAGLTELIPVVGPVLGAIPGILVTLATSPEDVVWVVLLYAGVQVLENTLLVPRIQGHAVNIHPAAIMVILVVASQVGGLWGVIAAVPIAAVTKQVYKYLYNEWSDKETPAQIGASVEPDAMGRKHQPGSETPDDSKNETPADAGNPNR